MHQEPRRYSKNGKTHTNEQHRQTKRQPACRLVMTSYFGIVGNRQSTIPCQCLASLLLLRRDPILLLIFG